MPFEEENLDKIFNELMLSNSIDGVAHINQANSLLKDMLLMHQSLIESALHISQYIYLLYKDNSYSMDQKIIDSISIMYQCSEDFIAQAIEIGDIMEDDEEYEEEDESKEDDDGRE